jgi:hypothetical protein
MVDPFLLLDCFGSDQATDYIGGFPDHPHRGFETVTYMLAGRMRHKDSTGHEDVIGPGDVQWMTAGRGLIHSEMPEQAEGLMKGFQLWVNLPAAKKMTAPTYRAVQGSLLPIEDLENGGTVKVIAGLTDRGTLGPIKIDTVSPIFLDVEIPPPPPTTASQDRLRLEAGLTTPNGRYSAEVDDSGEIPLVRIEAITTEAPEPVFNLHTTGPHNFIAKGVLAHKSPSCGGLEPGLIGCLWTPFIRALWRVWKLSSDLLPHLLPLTVQNSPLLSRTDAGHSTAHLLKKWEPVPISLRREKEWVFDDYDTAAFGFWKLEAQEALVDAGLNRPAARHG